MTRDFRSASLAALALASAVPVMAQAADTDGEIVVTAQKREQQLLDVPLSVQAFTGQALEERGQREINDLVNAIPGASSVSRTAPGFETIQIRGISSGTTGDATTGYYIDDVPFGVPNLQLAPPSRLFDLQRVEVLRGPQGTLYGQGAMGGTIRMVTTAPDTNNFAFRALGEGSGTDGGKGNWDVDAAVNVPLAKDVAGLRVSGGYESLGGWVDSTALGQNNINNSQSWNVRGKLRIVPAPNVTIDLGIWHVDNHLDYRNTIDSVEPPLINTSGPAGRPNFIDTRMTLYSGVVNADLGFGKLTSSTAYIDHDLNFDASFLAGGILRNTSDFKTKSFAQEVRLASPGTGAFNWIFGGYFNDAKIDSTICLSLFLPCTTTFSININSVGQIKTTAWAAFGEASYAFLDNRLTATIGGRYFSDRRRSIGVDLNSNTTTTNAATFDTFNPRFNLSYKAADGVLFYGNIAKGFRSGSFQTQAQATAASMALGITVPTAIQPDKVWNYEIGTKGKLFDGAVQFELAGYIINWTNIQLQSTISGVATLSNGGNARAKGIDVSLLWKTPLAGLTLQAIGNVNDTTFTSVLPAIVALNPLAAPGTRIPGVPKGNAFANATYTVPVASWDGKLSFAVDYLYRSSQLDSTGLVSDSDSEVNLRVGFTTKRWNAQVFADNVGNNRVALTRGSLGVQPNVPRRIGARFGVSF